MPPGIGARTEQTAARHALTPQCTKGLMGNKARKTGRKGHIMTFDPDHFDPDSEVNKSAAAATQALASAMARAVEGDTLPLPPAGLPALRSIPGSKISGAQVLGYSIVRAEVRDCIAPDGSRKVPGDPGFREAQMGRLGVAPMPKGWMFEVRNATKLHALVDGNPILLEHAAKSLGYSRAVAVGPATLDLGEIEL